MSCQGNCECNTKKADTFGLGKGIAIAGIWIVVGVTAFAAPAAMLVVVVGAVVATYAITGGGDSE